MDNKDAKTKTVKFKQYSSSVDGRLAVEGTSGSTESNPYIFLADKDSDGFKLTGTANEFQIGAYKVGHLWIKRGTFECGVANIGGGDGTSGKVFVIGGAGNNATFTATGQTSINAGSLQVNANGTFTAKGKICVNTGTLQVNANGKLSQQNWFAVGAAANKTGTLEIDGGEVETTVNRLTIGDVDNATGIVKVKNGGKYSNTGTSGTGLTVGQKETGTLEVDGGEVDLGTRTLGVCDNESSTATVTVKGGGVIKMKAVQYGSGTGGATITIDGGTLQATENNVDFIPANGNLNVYVGASGATFDTAGHVITIGENLQNKSGEAGAATFKGGGSVTLSAQGSYTGTTTVEVGTTLIVPTPGSIGAGLVVAVPAETPADGTYTLLSCSGEGEFTDAVLDGVAAPAGATLSLSQNRKAVLCTYGDGGPVWVGGTSGSLSDPSNWANNAVPGAGTNCVIGVSEAATLTVGDTFAASSITFPADSAAITINAADGESMTGIAAITNLSLTTSHTINVPVYFTGDIRVNQAADHYDNRAEPHITFAGGAHAGADCAIENGATVNWSHCMFGKYYLANASGNRWTATQYSNCRLAVADGSTLYIPYAGNLMELYVGADAKVFVGDMALDGRFMYRMDAGAEMVVTNLTVTGSDNRYVSYDQGTSVPGTFKFNSVTNSLTGDDKRFYLADGHIASSHVFFIGEGGLNFLNAGATSYYNLGRGDGGNAETIRPWYSDFTIAGSDGRSASGWDVILHGAIDFCTDDENETGRTITIDAVTRATAETAITVSGKGTLRVDKAAINYGQPAVTVSDTATLAFKEGASLGSGALTLGDGTTLEFDDITVGGTPLSVASLALPGNATLKIGNAALADGDYALLASAAGLPALSAITNVVANTASATRLYTADNGTLRLMVGDGALPYVWTGAENDGKMNTPGNWLAGAAPTTPGVAVFIPAGAGTLDNNIEGFAPASITFGYGTGAVTIESNAISGVAAITNLSSASHTINAPVAFADKIFVVQGAMSWEQKANPSINFAGGVTGTTFADGTARYLDGAFSLSTGAGWVANTQGSNNRWGLPAGSSLTLPEATDTCELALGDSGVAGGAFTAGVMRTSARLLCWNYGEYVVTNEFEAVFPEEAVHYCGHEGISNGKFKFEKMTLSGGAGSNPIFKFGNGRDAADTGTQRFLIGSGGLCFANSASQTLRYETGGAKNDATVRIDPWHGDYTIHTKIASNPTDFTVSAKTYFGTTDEDGNACMVTDEGVINSYGSAADINIDGNGQFVVNAVCAATCPVTVTNTATLAINAGKKLTTGATTVNSGATLEVAESGTVALGGNLTLKNGAVLGFDYTNRNAPVLDLTGKTVTFDEGATTNVVVKISSAEGARAKPGANVLTSGGKFANATVSLAPGAPDWAMGVSVVDGNVVLDVRPLGTIFFVK